MLYLSTNIPFENRTAQSTVADPKFELRRGPGFIILYQPACLPLVISSFSSKISGRGASLVLRLVKFQVKLKTIKETSYSISRNCLLLLIL